ncbi:AAA family ATPase [Streptosporangium subroseum]|uniref:AAA family ATPase n=1 Tax=Streptosporangium subroseum TaxID=106412 RepID=UPI00308A465A|nr:ATP-binding protein [Streptosporangium subroseum]
MRSGEPGIGKTALLDYAAKNAEGVQVIRRIGIQHESDLAFAGLHLLLHPVLDRMGALPEPQRRALEGAFGLARADGADRLLVGLAVLSLLAEVAEDGPVLCLFDDAQWLDRSSREALVFAARRLDAEGVALVMATREDHLPGLPVLRLRGLSTAASAAVLDSARLAPALRYRVLAEAQGNPLALIELPAMLRGDGYRPGALPLSSRLQAAFHDQVDHLPDATRTLLLVAAAGEGLDEVLAAGARFHAGAGDLLPAELERTAVRAAGRRGHAAAATAYERAAELTGDGDARGRRLTLAAEAATEAGELDRARTLAEDAGRQVTDPLLRSRLAHVRATAHFWRGAYGEAHRLIIMAADLGTPSPGTNGGRGSPSPEPSRNAAGRSWDPTPRPRSTTWRRWRAAARPSSMPAPACCTASGCAAPVAGPPPPGSCGSRWRSSSDWAPNPGPTVPEVSWRRPAPRRRASRPAGS